MSLQPVFAVSIQNKCVCWKPSQIKNVLRIEKVKESENDYTVSSVSREGKKIEGKAGKFMNEDVCWPFFMIFYFMIV